MNAVDILHYGQQHVLDALQDFDDWETPGVTSRWTAHEWLAHLASYERFMEEALSEVLGRGSGPTLDAMRADSKGFNDAQIAARHGRSVDEIRRELEEAHARVEALAKELGPERLSAPGTIPWYGPSYSLDDLIVYANYAHKREHAAQLRAFKARKAEAVPRGD